MRIPLTRGMTALVDAEDKEALATFRWCASSADPRRAYAQRVSQGKTIYMHRFILGVTDPDVVVDHINGNRLDNRRSNLRKTTRSGNSSRQRRERAPAAPTIPLRDVPELPSLPDGSRQIQLTQGKIARVSAEDYESLMEHRWSAMKVKGGRFYAVRRVGGRKGRLELMHRVVIGARRGQQVDHINGDPLDNRRENLRVCDHAQNAANSGKARIKNSTSKLKGVRWRGDKRGWYGGLTINFADGRPGVSLVFKSASEDEAARYYDCLAVMRWGEFASVNFPGDEIPDHIVKAVLKRVKARQLASLLPGLNRFSV